MLSIGSMAAGQGGYYAALAAEDYYLAGGEPPGFWLGSGAEALGLAGSVNNREFLKLFDGYAPDGASLVQSAGSARHRPGWDLTFSAPKSVSTAWSQADQETALEIRAAHLSAVEKAIGYLEDGALWTRRGKAGVEQERCRAVVAAFEHGTSRAQDPQLHTHALLLNIAIREDGTTGTLETRGVYEHKMAAGALYRAELAYQLECRLGLFAERERSWFELKGVPAELNDEFSKRRQEIEKILADKGLKSARASEIAALDSREVKEHIPREELVEQWKAVGKEHGWSEEQLASLMGGPRQARDVQDQLRAAVVKAVGTITEKQAHFGERDLVRVVAEEAQTLGAGAAAIVDQCRACLAESPEVVRLGVRGNERRFTTHEMLRLEEDLLQKVSASREAAWQTVPVETLADVFGTRPTIKEEQKRAVEHITQGTGSIATVTGMAGTGKTFMLSAANEALESAGFRVLGAALSGKAARGLQEGSGIESCTIAKLLMQLENGKARLNESTVLILDEAGMIGTRQMHAVVGWCGKAKAKLVLVGDEKQLQPIDAGAPFAAISKELGTSVLSDIVRQREEWQRETVRQFAAGQSGEALEAYAERGMVSVGKDRDEAKGELLSRWKEAGLQKPQDNLIVVSTNLDAAVLNREAQALRKEAGFLSQAAIELSGESFHEGDRVLFTKNSTAIGVMNGLLGTVKSLNGRTGTMEVALDGGETRRFSTAAYSNLKLGYAVTTHKAQGMTAENVFILTSESMQDREISYVQASRARGETLLFTTDAEAGDGLSQLARTMHRSQKKDMAHDISRDTPTSFQSPSGHQNQSSHDHALSP